ncbi:MAG: hypothetical protein WKG01_30905 [Kofleriaceae bacterium]
MSNAARAVGLVEVRRRDPALLPQRDVGLVIEWSATIGGREGCLRLLDILLRERLLAERDLRGAVPARRARGAVPVRTGATRRAQRELRTARRSRTAHEDEQPDPHPRRRYHRR